MDKEKNIGLYIHIPFCAHKCDYCDFISFENINGKINQYIEALIKELEYEKLDKYNIETIYIGGGTPSFIESKYIVQILSKINKENAKEITIEVNPGTVTEEKLKDYIKAGVNRISIGLQSTDNAILRQIGRIHNFEQFLETYNLARKVGFKNINVDLMIGLPNQSLKIVEDSLEKVIELNPEHISVYSLIVEENTKIEGKISNGILELPSEELERKMYWLVKNRLEEAGYKHYEISNFAKPGFESKHNVDCWEQKEYIGIGLAAHSYMNKARYSDTVDFEKYCENPMKNRTVHEHQTEETQAKEYMLLGLRKIDGVDIQKFKNKFVNNPIYLYKDKLNKLVKNNLLEIDINYIKLTDKGIDLANIVWEEFIWIM